MNTIQSLLHEAQLEMAVPASDPTLTIPARPLPDDRLWPADLAAILENNPHAVKLQIEGTPTACPNCGGFGMLGIYVWIRGPFQVPGAGVKVKWLNTDGLAPGWYTGESHYSPCPCCQDDQWREYLRANCGLKGKDLNISLETFKASGPYFEKEEARGVARGLLAMNDYPAGFVTFYGGVGRGKSHILKALVNGFRGVGAYARYVNAADLIQEIKDHFSDGNGGIVVEETIRHYRKVRVLAIDELDKVKLTEWTLQTLHRLLDTRYESAGLLTVLAMNTKPEDLPGDLEYLSSRISGGVAVEVVGGDMRGDQGLRARSLLAEYAEDGETA